MIDILVTLIIYLLVLGIAWWALSQWPMPAPFRIAVNCCIALIAIILLLGLVGVVPGWHVHTHWR